MKTNNLIKFAASLMLCCMFFGCTPEDETEKLGTIYGTVTDFASGEPISNVNVRLNPKGETTLTGMDGTFEFVDLPSGSYSLSLSKNGYVDLDDDYVIEIENGINVQRSIQLQKLHCSIQIVDNDNHPITMLDFGADAGVNQKTFSILNDGNMVLDFTITKTANWIEEIVPLTGTVGINDSKPIYVIINRESLEDGVNNSNLLITTPATGGIELAVKAANYGVPDVATGNVTNITHKSAACTGDVVSGGGSIVSMRDVCWNTSPNPTVNDNMATSGSGIGLFSCEMNNLQNNTTYYVRAFAKNTSGYSYGEERTFKTDVFPTFQFGGNTYYVAPTAGSKMNLSEAISYCSGLSTNGLSGWRLPTRDELSQMYSEMNTIGGVSTGASTSVYISSTSAGSGKHYVLDFYYGSIGTADDSHRSSVRPIKRKN